MSTYLKDEDLAAVDAWWRAANYLTVGQIYLMANPKLREPLKAEHVKPRPLGHWGTSPGLNLLWAHLNRAIIAREVNMLFVTGPGHGGPAIVANTWLEGTYSEVYPAVSRDEAGMAQLFRQFSFPGGIPSHVAPEVPGSIHEGGELGYSLMHAFGAVLDNPDLIAACVIGDGEAETGPLAASWLANMFVNPISDGAVLPILHLNGFKIANPTVLSRIPDEDLMSLLRGYGYAPIEVAGNDPEPVHHELAQAIDWALDEIADIQAHARAHQDASRPRWPVIVLRTPKGWTGPGEGTTRSHQVPLTEVRDDPSALEEWLRSYRAEFDNLTLIPQGGKRMSANPHTNGGVILRELALPAIDGFAVAEGSQAEATRQLGAWLKAVAQSNPDRFRLFGPDEIASNRLGAVLDVPGRCIEVLSEHVCQGLLEGYLLTGRHGLLTSYEAFIHVVDSMVNQHAKWLKVTRDIPWRRPLASLTYLLTSHVWRQDHNGFSHQDPGFIDHVVNKKAEVVRVYLPPDANTLLSTMEHCLRSRHYINVVVAGKQPAPNWLSMADAKLHCRRGLGIWDWASSDQDGEPDVVLACAGDVPTLETLAAASLLRQHLPELKVRVVNVVDLMRLQPPSEHPHGMPDHEFDAVFTTDKPVIFAYHGYPWLIHRLAYRRNGHANLHVRGYKEEGTTTTPFDMVMLNDLDRFHLVMDVIDRVPGLAVRHAGLRQQMADARQRCRDYTRVHGEDAPEIRDWQWTP